MHSQGRILFLLPNINVINFFLKSSFAFVSRQCMFTFRSCSNWGPWMMQRYLSVRRHRCLSSHCMCTSTAPGGLVPWYTTCDMCNERPAMSLDDRKCLSVPVVKTRSVTLSRNGISKQLLLLLRRTQWFTMCALLWIRLAAWVWYVHDPLTIWFTVARWKDALFFTLSPNQSINYMPVCFPKGSLIKLITTAVIFPS